MANIPNAVLGERKVEGFDFVVGANNVFEQVGPVMYTQPNANVSYYGGFNIGCFIHMKYTQRF